jgi:hypothetical protein
MTYPRLKFTIKRRPPPPALPPFECVVCEEQIERDPFSPDFQAPPICWSCCWAHGHNRMQTHQLPFEMWSGFRAAYALLKAMDKEIARARRTH